MLFVFLFCVFLIKMVNIVTMCWRCEINHTPDDQFPEQQPYLKGGNWGCLEGRHLWNSAERGNFSAQQNCLFTN